MSPPLQPPLPRQVTIANWTLLVLVFVLPCVIGRIDTYLVLIAALVAILSRSVPTSRRLAPASPIGPVFVGAFLAIALALCVSAEDGYDLLFIFNFSPLLLAVPVRWQFARMARPDAAVLIGWLCLAGTIGATGLAVIQVFGLGYDRVGQPIMNVFHYAFTTMLLGFMTLAGFFAPGPHKRLPFLLGPLLGLISAVLSGTRGALIGAPVLLLVAFGFLLAVSRRRGWMLIGAAALVVLLVAAAALAPQLGFGRAIEGFEVALRAFSGGRIDHAAEERLIMLAGAVEAFLEAPLFGHGWIDMVPAILPHVPADQVETMKAFRHLHNGAASFAVGTGLVGLISFALLSIIPVVAVLMTPRDRQFVSRLYLAVTLCAGYFVFQMTFLMLGFEFHTVQYVMMAMVFVAFVRDPVAPYSSGNAGPAASTA